MKVGNVSQTVLKRSVLKQLHTKRKEILTDLSVEEMCTAVQIRDTEDVVFASAVVSGNSKNIGVYAIMRAVLDLETRGASAIGVSVQVILPTYAYFPCASQCEAGKYTKRGTTGDCNAADWKRWYSGIFVGTDRGGKCGNAD